VGGLEEVELALQVEVEEALDGAVGGDDAGGDGGVLGLGLQFGEFFALVAASGSQGDRQSAALGGVFGAGVEDGVGNFLGFEWFEFLTIVGVEVEAEADAVEGDFDAVIRIVAEGDLDGEDASGEGGFFGEFFFVLGSLRPGEGGDGDALMGLEGCGFYRGLLRSRLFCGGSRDGGENSAAGSREKKCDDERYEHGKSGHQAIISIYHLEAFDSQGRCRVALRRYRLRARGVRKAHPKLTEKIRSLNSCFSFIAH
jgi:hypothetical protein